MEEEWRDIPGYEGRYQASNMGQVRSLSGMISRVCACGCGAVSSVVHHGRVLKHQYRGGKIKPYAVVDMDKTSRPVHHLVLLAFVGPRPEKAQGCHRNDNQLDNRLENLYWGSWHENRADAERNGVLKVNRGTKHGMARLTDEQVLEMRRLRATGMTCEEIGKRFGVGVEHAHAVVTGRTWKHLPGAVDIGRKGNSRITAEDREEIVRLYESGTPSRELVARFGITRSHVSKLALKKKGATVSAV